MSRSAGKGDAPPTVRKYPPPPGFAAVEVLAPDRRPATAAANLFAALRRLDARGLDLLLAEPCPDEGLGSAIMDRLRRCAAGAVC